MGLRPRWQGTVIVAVEEEAPVHTAENPYCDNFACPECRTNVTNHGIWTGASSSDGEVNTSLLDREVDDDWFATAMMTLGAS
jgi:hypothetical protein